MGLWYKITMVRDHILVVHLGGLGDVCLSESTFLSLALHFREKLIAVGNRRFLSLFPDYFSSVHSVEGREWLYLFADGLSGPGWRRIVFIGKDRSASFRQRLAQFSREALLFVDMYPDSPGKHVQEYQLAQLRGLGIGPVKKPTPPKSGDKIIVYPEKGYTKQKWPYENFLRLYDGLHSQGASVSLLEPFDTETPHSGSFRFDDLSHVKSFLNQSDLFVSNDCGMAHLAASSGLSTITLFHDTDPTVWHPLGDNRSIRYTPSPSTEELLALVKDMSSKR